MPPEKVERVPRKARNLQGRDSNSSNTNKKPAKRGVGRNHTFKFRSSIFVAQRKSSDITDYYDLQEELNEGAYGVVYKAIHKESGAERAVKRIEKSKWCPEENQKILDEFNVLKGLDHPNILKMYELFEEEKHFYIVTEICKGGDLLDELEELEGDTGAFQERDAAILVTQVLSSINYCHKNNIVHRDLKPENILLEQNKALHEIKLIDFGFAVPCDENMTMCEQKGTAAYMSPQAMLEEPYGQKCDVWAVGVIAYIVLAGFNPFEGHTDPETAVLVEMGEYELDIPEWDHISDEAKDFVTKCLAYEEKDRITAAEALDHPWIRNCRSNMHSNFYKNDSVECEAAMANLQKFHAKSKLKQATCTYIASQLVSKKEKETIDKLFRSMDTDSDGKLRKEEVKVGYKAIFGKELSEDDVEYLYSHVDMNGDGIIEYSEFVVAAVNEDILLRDENLHKAFQMFDKDKDGFISRGDLVKVMNSFGGTVSDVVIDKIMNQIDRDNSGRISFEGFRDSMFSTAELNPQVDEEEEKLADLAPAISSKRINAKPAVMLPRRRPSAAEDMVKAVMAQKDGGQELLRNLSNSSGRSNLASTSSDDADSADTPPARRINTPPPSSIKVKKEESPVRARAAKKGVMRTKSGFMTQRNEKAAVRKGKKPAHIERLKKDADTIPPPPVKPMLLKSPVRGAPVLPKSPVKSGVSKDADTIPPPPNKPILPKSPVRLPKSLVKSGVSKVADTILSPPNKPTLHKSPVSGAPELPKSPVRSFVSPKKMAVASPAPAPSSQKKAPVIRTSSDESHSSSHSSASGSSRSVSVQEPDNLVDAKPLQSEMNDLMIEPPEEKKSDATIVEKKNGVPITKVKENNSSNPYLEDTLSNLPSSNHSIDQPKNANPSFPTQKSNQERHSMTSKARDKEIDSSAPKRVSAPASTIKDRMTAFAGTSTVSSTYLKSSTPKHSPVSPRPLPRAAPKESPTAALQSTLNNGDSQQQLMEDDSYTYYNAIDDNKMSQSENFGSHRRQDHNDLLEEKFVQVRRNSLDTTTAAAEAEEPLPKARGSLRDRMKLFEQNIKKNQDRGVNKKLF